jgi:hypothetical protein
MLKHVRILFFIGFIYGQGGGYALDFDGSDDYVEISNPSTSQTYTFSCWFKSNQHTGYIVSRGNNTHWIEFHNSGSLISGTSSNTFGTTYNYNSSFTLSTGTWYHVAITYDGSNLKQYINGTQMFSITGSNVTPNSNMLLADDPVESITFTGSIDEVRLWTAVRTQAQIQASMHVDLAGSESNLVAYYKMSNGSGTSLTDNSSNSYTGTLTNMVTSGGSSDWVTSYAPIGDLNSSYETDVEGIWKASGTNASDASDGLTMTVSSALSTGNFAVYGNNNTSGTSASDVGSVGSTYRTGRIWQVDESGTVAGTITIDISDATGNSGGTGTASNFILLYRSGTSGNFTSAATGASISGDAVSFTSVSLADGYYAMGAQSDASLPVELTSFEVLDTRDNGITLHWITESEINNLGFILDRRTPTIDWIEIASFVTHPELQGQGSVSHQTIYTYTDNTVTDDETYDYRIADVDYDGNKEYHSLQLMGISPASIPSTYVLHQNYPNPFNPITTLSYDLPEDAMVNITIYDMMGRIVNNLVSSQQNIGYKSIQWNATNNTGQPVSAGLYLYTIQAGEFRQAKKMVLLK